MFRLHQPIPLALLLAAGRFASPEGEGDKGAGEKGTQGEKGTGDGKPTDAARGEKTGEGDKGDAVTRITTLVDERNTARTEAADWKAKYEQSQQQLQQLQANDQSKVVTDLQKQLSDVQTATRTRFDKLLETSLADLPEPARKAVLAIPGGSEAQFDWLVANRAILQPAGDREPGDKKPAGPSNDKKPPKGDEGGASSVAKSYVESRKPKAAGFPGLTG